METKNIWDGVVIQDDGGISNGDSRSVRKRLRVFITANIRELSLIVEQLRDIQNSLANIESMEFAVEDLTDPDKEF